MAQHSFTGKKHKYTDLRLLHVINTWFQAQQISLRAPLQGAAPGELNGMILEPSPVYYERFMTIAATFRRNVAVVTNIRNYQHSRPKQYLTGYCRGELSDMRYLGIYFVQSRKLKCSLDAAKRGFYCAPNSIFSKIGRTASEEVILQMNASPDVRLRDSALTEKSAKFT